MGGHSKTILQQIFARGVRHDSGYAYHSDDTSYCLFHAMRIEEPRRDVYISITFSIVGLGPADLATRAVRTSQACVTCAVADTSFL